jgi:hypothetical protein
MSSIVITPDLDLSINPSRARAWTGRILTGLFVLFLAWDSISKILYVDEVHKAAVAMGFSKASMVGIGLTLFACVALYLTKRTALLGAILLTGYFGGAMATHVALKTGAFPIAFSAAFGVLTWVALGLRDQRVAQLARL